MHRLISGERACPPDDVGGVMGFRYFLLAMADPKHPAHDSMVGCVFDPEEFDLEDTTAALGRTMVSTGF